MFLLKHYVSPQGVDLFGLWLDSLRDKQAQARIAARMMRLQNGNFGDCKPVGSGVWELRIDWGPGYRIYYALEDKKVVLLCRSGVRSIAAAKRATELGVEAYNILEGFEGDANLHAHRGFKGGWRFRMLPWRQN